jgi:MFS family permease
MSRADSGASKRFHRALAVVMCRGLGSCGSAVAIFGLEILLFQRTGSYTAFLLLVILTGTPTLLLSPVAGVVADRFHKGMVLVACDMVSIIVMMTASGLNAIAPLPAWVIGVLIISLSVVETFRWPSVSAALPALAAPEKLTKLNSLSEALRSANIIFGPLIGIATFQTIKLQGMLWLDIMALWIGLVGLFKYRIMADEALNPSQAATTVRGRKLWSSENVFFGLKWIFQDLAFRQLVVLFAVANCGFVLLAAVITPYVLSFSDPTLLALNMLIDGIGVLSGGALLAVIVRWCPLYSIVLCGVLGEAIAMTLWGTARDMTLLLPCAFGVGFCSATAGGASQTLWQSLVPHTIQGRVFAARIFIASALSPIALLISLPLGLKVVAPFLDWNRTHGWEWIDFLWGGDRAGPLGFMLSVSGGIVILATIVAAASGRLKGLGRANNKANQYDEPLPSPQSVYADTF